MTAVCGYGPAGSDVPTPIRQAMMLMIEGLYEHRSTVEPGITVQEIPGPIAYENLLASYRVWEAS